MLRDVMWILRPSTPDPLKGEKSHPEESLSDHAMIRVCEADTWVSMMKHNGNKNGESKKILLDPLDSLLARRDATA